MNNMYGITGIQVKFFSCSFGDNDDLNDFLAEYDRNIIDIQFHQVNSLGSKVMVVYKAFEE